MIELLVLNPPGGRGRRRTTRRPTRRKTTAKRKNPITWVPKRGSREAKTYMEMMRSIATARGARAKAIARKKFKAYRSKKTKTAVSGRRVRTVSGSRRRRAAGGGAAYMRHNAWAGARTAHRKAALKGWRKRKRLRTVKRTTIKRKTAAKPKRRKATRNARGWFAKKHKSFPGVKRRVGVRKKRTAHTRPGWTKPGTRRKRMAANPKRRRRRYTRNAWKADRAGHRSAALKGWRRRKSSRKTTRRRRSYARNSWYKQPIRHARAARLGVRRRKRRSPARRQYSRNMARRRYPMARNQRQPMTFMKSIQNVFTMPSMITGMQAAVGAGSTVFISSTIRNFIPANMLPQQPMARTLVDGALDLTSAALTSSVIGMMDRKFARNALAGGLAITFIRVIGGFIDQFGVRIPFVKIVPTGMVGMGNNDVTNAVRRAIEEEVSRELAAETGTAAFLEPIQADTAAMGAALTERQAEAAPMGDASYAGSELFGAGF